MKKTFDSVNKDINELSTETNHSGKAAPLNDGCQFQKGWICPQDCRQSRSKNTVEAEDVQPVAFGSKIFSLAQLKMSIYSKKILTIFMEFLEFAQFLWEATKPTIAPTVNQSVTRFFQKKAIAPALWNACDYVLKLDFKIANVPGSVHTAADFLSRLELNVTEKTRLKILEDIQTTPIEVSTSSSEFGDGDQFFFTQADNENESEEQTLERKNNVDKMRNNG